MINRWGWCHRTKQKMRQSCFEWVPSGKTEGVWHYKFGHVPLTTVTLTTSLPIIETYEHFLCAYIAAYCKVTCLWVTCSAEETPVSQSSNTCTAQQEHFMKLSGNTIQSGLQRSKENICHDQTFSFSGSTENTTSHCGYWGVWKYPVKTTWIR